MSPRNMDVPGLDWGDCCMTDGTGCVVALPHDADRFTVALRAKQTETGCDLDPWTKVEITKCWGRIYTVREQWDMEREQNGWDRREPPEGWWADEGVPGWTHVDEPREGFEPIWLVTW